MAVSNYKGQIPFRAKGHTSCIHHKGTRLDVYCEECKELACMKCLSTVHKSHTVCDLREMTLQKKQDIQSFINKTETVDLVQIDRYITSTDKHQKDNTSNFEKLSHQLKTQTNKLKHDLDLLTAQTLSLYQQMEEDNTKLLQTYKQDLEMYSKQLKQQVEECKIALQRGSDIQVYDTGCEIQSPVTIPVNAGEIQSSVTIPVKPTLGTASFSPNRNPQGHLEQALGEVNTSDPCQGQGLQGHEQSIGSSTGQRLPSTQHRSKGRKEVTSPVYNLLSQTKVVGVWMSPCNITSVSPTTDGQVWTSNFYTNTLTLLDRKGKVIPEVTHNTLIGDISLSSTTNTLWVCDQYNNITELVSGRLVHRFSTSERPRCICVTASNHFIVGMVNNISKFTTKGKLVLTTSATRTGNPLVCTPDRISECPVTHNVAVADRDSKGDGGGGKPHVVVMDTDFKELFVYDGEVQHTYQPPPQSGVKPFHPCGVVYDSVGNLVIGDRNNNRILLISGRGKFLRIIHTDNNMPRAVGVDREDVLWTVFGKIVKLLQYSSVCDIWTDYQVYI